MQARRARLRVSIQRTTALVGVDRFGTPQQLYLININGGRVLWAGGAGRHSAGCRPLPAPMHRPSRRAALPEWRASQAPPTAALRIECGRRLGSPSTVVPGCVPLLPRTTVFAGADSRCFVIRFLLKHAYHPIHARKAEKAHCGSHCQV